MNVQPSTLSSSSNPLLGVGLYTPAEASRLVDVRASKIIRWLKGYQADGRTYEPLWRPQVDLGDDRIYLGFRDLMEVRVANAFIERAGLSPQRVRYAIEAARELIGDERPLSTARFRTDGRTVFLQFSREDGSAEMVDLFRSQYAFREIIEPSLKNIEFDAQGIPARWWPLGRNAHVVVDPARSFGRPIESESLVPSAILAAAAEAEGSARRAARMWNVPERSVRRAIAFETAFAQRKAA